MPIEPFLDLLVAFRQDQEVARYETINQLVAYCRYSANPVGRMVLYLGQCHTPEGVLLSDKICTGLQLANFWQDIARDWDRGRIYVPQAACRRFGYDQTCFARGIQRCLSPTAGRTGVSSRMLAPVRVAVSRKDAEGIAVAGGIVCGRRFGYAGSDSSPAIRRLDAPPDRLAIRQTAVADRLLVEAAFPRSGTLEE